MVVRYLIYCVRFIAVYYPNFERFREINDWTFFNINHIVDGQRDLDTVPIVMRSENDFLQSFDPFFGTCMTVCFEVVRSLVGHDIEARIVFDTFLLLRQ